MSHTAGEKSLSMELFCKVLVQKSPYLASLKITYALPLKMCRISFLSFLVKINSISIRHWCIGIYFGSYRYSHACGYDISCNGGNQIILKYLSQFGSSPSPCMASLFGFVSNWRMYCIFLIWCGFLNWCFLGIIFLHWWYFFLFLWFWEILTGSATLIWCRDKCRWWIIFIVFPYRQAAQMGRGKSAKLFGQTPLVYMDWRRFKCVYPYL